MVTLPKRSSAKQHVQRPLPDLLATGNVAVKQAEGLASCTSRHAVMPTVPRYMTSAEVLCANNDW